MAKALSKWKKDFMTGSVALFAGNDRSFAEVVMI
jgi:hypothetical protein